MALEGATQEQARLQKLLESARKQNRQHQMLAQEYRSKQQVGWLVIGVLYNQPSNKYYMVSTYYKIYNVAYNKYLDKVTLGTLPFLFLSPF